MDFSRRTWRFIALLGLMIVPTFGSACIEEPRDRLADRFPPSAEPDGPNHRAGQACSYCHSGFSVAGTVYLNQQDELGLGGATVHIRDANGKNVHYTTNRVGNFYSEDVLAFPLRVDVRYEGFYREMKTPIVRESGCAHCHQSEIGPDSVGKIFLNEGREF